MVSTEVNDEQRQHEQWLCQYNDVFANILNDAGTVKGFKVSHWHSGQPSNKKGPYGQTPKQK